MNSDLALKLVPDFTEWDLTLLNSDLATDAGLEAAVIISLFSDRRITAEELPSGQTSQRGWWGDEFLTDANDKIGSKIWLLAREKKTDDVLTRAKDYASESLQWMIDDGVAAAVSVSTEYNANGFLAWLIVITRPNQKKPEFRFAANWTAELGG